MSLFCSQSQRKHFQSVTFKYISCYRFHCRYTFPDYFFLVSKILNKGCWILATASFCIYWDDYMIFSPLWSVKMANYIDFLMLKQHLQLHPGIRQLWTWCVFLFMYCSPWLVHIFFRIFTCVKLARHFLSHTVLVGFWYQDYSSFTKYNG